MKKLIAFIAVFALIFTACGEKTKISEKKAEEIALSNAGLTQEDVNYIRTEKDRDNGKTVYEIEFRTKDNVEFDYEIDANTGDVLSYDSDKEGFSLTPDKQEKTETAQAVMSEEEAKEIALAKVSGATAENIREFRKDFDDGREEYDGKIVYNKTEYEFEIDAKTGEIITWESESVFD